MLIAQVRSPDVDLRDTVSVGCSTTGAATKDRRDGRARGDTFEIFDLYGDKNDCGTIASDVAASSAARILSD